MPFDPNNLHDLQFSTEKQIMDRKSARIAPRVLLSPFKGTRKIDLIHIAIPYLISPNKRQEESSC